MCGVWVCGVCGAWVWDVEWGVWVGITGVWSYGAMGLCGVEFAVWSVWCRL